MSTPGSNEDARKDSKGYPTINIGIAPEPKRVKTSTEGTKKDEEKKKADEKAAAVKFVGEKCVLS
jgi:hypothetical protein